MRPLKSFALAALGLALALAALPAAALAGAVELKPEVTASDGRVTLGDLFSDAGAAAGVVVARVQPGQAAVLDATQVQIIARSSGVDWGNPANLRRIFVQPGGVAPEAPSRAVKKAGPQVLTFLHSLNAGDIVRADDLTWSRDAVAGADAPRDAETVIGMAARRPVREGEAVSLRDVSTPLVIRKDDMVSVVFSQAGLSLTLQAKALADAAIGQSVSVINPASKKIIQAVAAAPGQALVGPEADQLKAVSRLSPSRLALR